LRPVPVPGKEVVGLSVIALTFATYSPQVVPGLPIHLVGALTLPGVTALNYVRPDQPAPR
jgi:APA family basic amino acid/polyamine antiporter